MITIQVLGTTPPCANCQRATREAQKAADRFPGQVRVVHVDALGPEAEAFGMVVTPAVAIDGTLIASGKVVPADVLARHIEQALRGA